MATPLLQPLLGEVRRRLWRDRFVAAARLALWGSTGLMLLAMAVHLAVHPVPFGVLLYAVALLWASMLVRAGWQRPTDPVCALWGDRHLGGASAFTTLLDTGTVTRRTSNDQAVRWLEDWAAVRIPHSLRLLAERQDSSRLFRPTLSMLVSAALAALVLTLPDLAVSVRPPVAKTAPSGIDHRAMAAAEAPASSEVVNEIVSALRSAPSRDTPERRGSDRAQAAGFGRTDDAQQPKTAQPGDAQPSERATRSNPSAGAGAAAVDMAPMGGSAQAIGSGAGRDAGDARDERTEAGASRASRGTMALQRSESRQPRRSTERQADMERSATFDEELSRGRAAAMQEGVAVAAAAPPPATESHRLTPAETSYVQAWMKASTQRR